MKGDCSRWQLELKLVLVENPLMGKRWTLLWHLCEYIVLLPHFRFSMGPMHPSVENPGKNTVNSTVEKH